MVSYPIPHQSYNEEYFFVTFKIVLQNCIYDLDYVELFADSSKFDEEFLINKVCAHLVQQARKAMFIVLRKLGS
jgi:hypothetical protein